MNLELILYHTQGIFFYTLLILLIVRMILNAFIYRKIDSDIIQENIPDMWTMIPFSEKQKEDMRRENPKIKDFSKDGSQTVYMEWLHYALTLWWPPAYQEPIQVKKLKKTANALNVVFVLLGLLCLFLFLHMQGVNVKYRHVDRDWFFFMNKG